MTVVDKIELDAAKGTITVTGDADPYELIVRKRKAGELVERVSVGPPPKQKQPTKPEEKKPEPKKDDKKPDPKKDGKKPETCPVCQQMAVVYMDRYAEPNMACSITQSLMFNPFDICI
ncbi:Heavy metal transport/detoxification superfamily protein, putative [Theobroma cacao]|uniref:Heavy metal transport/detoxification superfamily protein, putative n=1 Tax=Theobroma cacao TaxID=3641 RepID=A0A061DGY5_THECC|nr:Heavy metal transport/detoxification superfamily protein, putative [Theobroma cacao]